MQNAYAQAGLPVQGVHHCSGVVQPLIPREFAKSHFSNRPWSTDGSMQQVMMIGNLDKYGLDFLDVSIEEPLES